MKADFLPEWGHTALGNQYVGLYRFFTTQSWHQLRDPQTKKRRYFGTASEAIRAAREFVQGKLNPDITVQVTEPDPGTEELRNVLGLDAWRQQKQNERAENQIIRNRKTKTRVIVERKGARHVREKP